MEQEVDQVVQAIVIASDPTQGSLHQQALAFLSTVQQNAANTWRLALKIFIDQTPEGSRKYPAQARFFALRVLDEFLDNRLVFLDLHREISCYKVFGVRPSNYIPAGSSSTAFFDSLCIR
jgi:exportin-T